MKLSLWSASMNEVSDEDDEGEDDVDKGLSSPPL